MLDGNCFGGIDMNNYLICLQIIILYLIFSYMLGDLFLRLSSCKEQSVSYRILIGFFCYFFLFQLVAIPLKITLQPLSLLTKLWLFVLIFITALFLILRLKFFKDRMADCKTFLSKHKWILLVLFLLVLFQLILINYNGETYALWDQSYYIGDISSSVYTNSISQYNPYTGALLKKLDTEYLLETYQNHSAVLCQLLGLPPLIETRTAEASLMVILANLIYYQFGLQLFTNSRKKAASLVFFLFWLNLFSFNLFTSAEFLFFRAYEGKTILACIILPMVFLLFLKIAREHRERSHWIELFLVVSSSFGLNMSCIYMLPFELSICLIPLGLTKRSASIWIRYGICLIPCILYGAAYLFTKHSFFIYT